MLSYLDIIAQDATATGEAARSSGSSTDWWYRKLEPLSELVGNQPVPWVIEAGDVHVIFNTRPDLPYASEYEKLLRAALDLWEAWRADQRLT